MKKAMKIGISVLLSLVLALTVVLIVFKYTIPESPSVGEENSGATIGDFEGENIAVVSRKLSRTEFAAYGVSPMAETAYALTATVKPDTALNKAVNWSLSWKDTDAEWATGKTVTEYVSLGDETTQSGESVTVSCLKDFGETIIITAVSDEDETKKATCSVDYMRRVLSIDYTFKYGDSAISSVAADSDGVYRFDYTGEEKSYTVIPVPVYSACTMDLEYTSSTTGKFTDSFGYGNGVSLTAPILSAGISNVVSKPTLSSTALDYITKAEEICAGVPWQYSRVLINQANSLYEQMSSEEKTHSKVVNRKSAVQKIADCPNGSNPGYNNAVTAAKSIINSYSPPAASGVFMDVEVPSVDALLQAAQTCIDAKKGIVEYTVTFKSDELTYSSTISLGFTEKSVKAVRSLGINIPAIVF